VFVIWFVLVFLYEILYGDGYVVEVVVVVLEV